MTWVFDGDRQFGQVDLDLSAYSGIVLTWWARWYEYGTNDDMMLEFGPSVGTAQGFAVDPNNISGNLRIFLNGNIGLNRKDYARPTAGEEHFYCLALNFAAAAASEISAFWVDSVLISEATSSSLNNNSGSFANSTLNVFSRNADSLFGSGSIRGLSIYAYSGTGSGNQPAEMYAAGPDAIPPSQWGTVASHQLLHHFPMDGRQIIEPCTITSTPLLLNAMPWIESGDQEDEERPETAEFQDISSTVTVTASVTSAMQQTHTLVSAVSVTAEVSAAAFVASSVSSTVTAAVSVSAPLEHTHTLVSAVAVVSQVSAAFTIAGEMVSSVVIQSVVSANFKAAVGPPYCLCAGQWFSDGATSGAETVGQWWTAGGDVGQLYCECEE